MINIKKLLTNEYSVVIMYFEVICCENAQKAYCSLHRKACILFYEICLLFCDIVLYIVLDLELYGAADLFSPHKHRDI